MKLDDTSIEENKDSFISKVIESEVVLYLLSDDNVANSVTHDDEEQTILMFWSNVGFAQDVKNSDFEPFDVEELSLFDFLYLWLPGMHEDGVLAGVNWTADLIGIESNAYELLTEIEATMSDAMLASYEEAFSALVDES